MAGGQENGETLKAVVVKFLQKHHVASLSIHQGEGTWSANCFYAFDPETVRLVFLSNEKSLHSKLMTTHPQISGTVAGNARTVSRIEGVQFRGTALSSTNSAARRLYNERFPFARLVESTLWEIELSEVKYTSNLISFAKKTIWKKA
jgi:uncharacterized protein YhbP (UPF0306 family)